MLEELRSIQKRGDQRKRKLQVEVPFIDKRSKEEQPPTDKTQRNMGPISKNFVMKRVFKDVLSMEEGKSSDSGTEEHFGAFWDICIQHKNDYLTYLIYCMSSIVVDKWPIDVECEVKLSLNDGNDKLILNPTVKTLKDGKVWLCDEFVKCDDMEDYLIDGNLEFEVTFKIKKMTVAYHEMRKFDESMKTVSDVILNVNDKKFYVSKLNLTTHSRYFESLLLGKFDESVQLEIKLSGIDPNDFQKYLEVLYCLDSINEYNVEGILLIADLYDTQLVVKKM